MVETIPSFKDCAFVGSLADVLDKADVGNTWLVKHVSNRMIRIAWSGLPKSKDDTECVIRSILEAGKIAKHEYTTKSGKVLSSTAICEKMK